MRIRRLIVLFVGMSLIFMVSCGNKNTSDNTNTEVDTIEPVKVEIQTEPADGELKPNESFTIRAKVTQGEENVNDADEVQFEFWKEGQSSDEHEMIASEFQGDGIYAMEKKVEEPGTYYVISHVTARDMHVMPQKELAIGEVASEESSSGESSHEEHHSDSGMMIHIMMDSKVEKNKEIPLVSHIQKDGNPVTEANVRFEIWQDGVEKHEYIPAKEDTDGEYKTSFTFSKAGEYHVKVHLKKDDIHDHNETVITVQ